MLYRILFVASCFVCGCANQPNTSGVSSGVFRDGDDFAPDSGAHPQVVRVRGSSSRCTGWLSSSNTITTAAHCLANGTDFTTFSVDPTMNNQTAAQYAALQKLGTAIGGFIHPGGSACINTGDDCCWGADMAVLVFAPANAVPRDTMRPVRIKDATADEPECDGDDRCVMMIGTGVTGEDECQDDNAVNPPVDPSATQLHVESGLGDGHCPANGDMLYGEYDFDDSSSCNGDSGSPVYWKGTDEVFAQSRGTGGDGGDDLVGPVLWKGGPNTARDFYMSVAGDQDGDGLQAFDDNCDRDYNPGQADFNGDQIGDACQDSDGDGVLDADEIVAGTNPANSDSDGDGLSDGAEVNTYHTNPLDSDTDHDGLSDGAEVNTYHTNPLDSDTDHDGLSDGVELNTYHTDPLDPDTDDDLLSDGFEVDHGTLPLDADSDDDGVVDGQDTAWLEAAVAALPDAAFQAPGHRNAMRAHLAQVERFARHGEFAKAEQHLNNLRDHVDGCGVTADNTDWLVDCAIQLEIRALLDLLEANL